MRQEHRFALLEIGAAGSLLVSGELEEVQPLDDAELLDAAGPEKKRSSISWLYSTRRPIGNTQTNALTPMFIGE